jgi:hypothetical protein
MPLGRLARRLSLEHANLPILFALALAIGLGAGVASTGCNSMPAATRIFPRAADVRTRVVPDRPVSPASRETDPEPTAARKLEFDRLDEESPLPPALARPAQPVEVPSATPPPTAPEPFPLVDPAIARAGTDPPPAVEPIASVKADEPAPKPEPEPAATIALPPPAAGPAPEAPKPDPTPPVVPTPEPKAATPVPAPPPTIAPEPKPPVVATPTPTPAPPEPKRPEDLWREGVQQLRAVARDRVHESNKDARPGSPNWAVRERLLSWLAEPDIDPDPRSAGEVAQGRAVLKGLAAVLDPTGPPTARSAEIREAIAVLEAQAPLEVAELKLCKKVHGFGNIEPLEAATRKAGQQVIVYCEMTGLAYEPAGLAFRSRLATTVELIPEGSDTPAWSQSLGTAEDACRRRRRDYYVGHRFALPESLAAGNYRLRLTEKDLVSDHVATRETPIAITR